MTFIEANLAAAEESEDGIVFEHTNEELTRGASYEAEGVDISDLEDLMDDIGDFGEYDDIDTVGTFGGLDVVIDGGNVPQIGFADDAEAVLNGDLPTAVWFTQSAVEDGIESAAAEKTER